MSHKRKSAHEGPRAQDAPPDELSADRVSGKDDGREPEKLRVERVKPQQRGIGRDQAADHPLRDVAEPC